MPVMNGYDLARALRSDEAGRALEPCIVLGLTANAQPEEIERCRQAGMDQCLFKPISLQDLSLCLASGTPGPESVSYAEPLAEGSDEIDFAYLQQLAQCDDALVHQVLTDMAVSTDEDLAQLMQLFVSDDFEGLAALAHKIKGGVALVQAKGLMRCCEQLEAACALGEPPLILPCVDALHAEMERFAQALEEHMQHQGTQ